MEHLPFRLLSESILADDAKVDKSDFLLKHIGKERFSKLQAAISKWADEKGVPMYARMPILLLLLFSPGGFFLRHSSFRGVMSQTTRAHRLCQKAYKMGGQNLQIPLLCAVFKAYMEDAKDIADINVLAELAESTGTMSKVEVCGAFP